MGNNCCRKRKVRRKITLLLVGLDNAGKTKAAYELAGDSESSPVPTVGFSVINLKYHQYDVKVFDLGGGPNIRGIWHKYFVDAYGVIFVIDSSDFSRFNEAKMVLQDMLYSDKITGKPLLILANKQDHENALDEIDVIEYLDIEQLVNVQKCPTLVQSCSATEKNKVDPGIQKGYDWLLGNIAKNYDFLNQRVENDVREQEVKDREDILEKIQRIKTLQEIEENKKKEDDIEIYSEYLKKLNDEASENDQVNDSVVCFEDIVDVDVVSNSTSDSSISFPPVYVSNTCALPERPKSSVEIVKHHLQLNNNVRKLSLKSRSNKTVPMNLYGVKLPRSADEKSRKFSGKRRNLKSAGDRLFTISNNLPNMVDVQASGDHNNFMTLNHFEKNKLPPLSKAKCNRIPWVHKALNGDNVISIVDVE